MLLTKRSTLTLITLIFVTLMALGLAAFPQASIHADPGGKGKDQETVVKQPTEEEQVAQEGNDPVKVVKEPAEEEQVAQEGNDPVKVVKEPTEVEPVAQEGNDPVKVAKEPTEEGQEAPNGNQFGVTRVRGKQFHSMTRKDCSFQLIKTELEFEYIMDLSDLKWGTPTSRDEVIKSEVVVTLEKLLKNKRSVVGRAELTMVARALNLSVSVILEMSEEEIQSLISRITTTTTQVMTIYSFPVTGKITVQEVTIRHDFWKWVGKDCGELGALPAEELVSKEIGDPRTYTIDSTVIIVEYHSSTVDARGYDWAEAKAREKIQRGAWVP